MHALAALLLILLFAAAGCVRGPGADELQNDVGERIAQALPPDTVSLVSFARRGSQSDTKAPAGEARRILYFDVKLKLERDFDFGAWDAPGVAGLISALGAGPRGITGIVSGGNKAGDVLRAHGTALYRREEDRWVAVVAGGHRPSVAPTYATSAAQGAAAIEEELAAAYTSMRARLARAAEGYAIAAGPAHGQYLRFVQALSNETRVRTVPLVTSGGEENLRLLRDGKVSLALTQGDAALDAYQGTGSFSDDGPHTALRAVGSLYPEPVHVVVRVDSPLASAADLRGRRVAIDVPGSASHTTALRVLQAHGLGARDFTPLALPLGEALARLQRKEIDAVIQVIGVPADSIRNALAATPLRLLPLAEHAITALVKAKAGYFAFAIPRGAYANHRQDVRTVATAALLLAGADLSETEVGTLTRFVFEKGRDLVARGSAQGTQVSAATAHQGLSVPMHVAAEKALEAVKYARGAN